MNRPLFRRSLLGILLFAGSCGAGARAPDNATPANEEPLVVSILQWNVENLFDSEDDPTNEGDDEFTKEGWRFWIPYLYREKLTHLAAVLVAVRPDIVTLQEVENRRVLEDLVEEVARQGGLRYAYIIHRDGTDHRGIDVAALSIFEPRSIEWFTPIEGQRDILRFEVQPYGRPLTIFVNHWKSNWGGEAESLVLREQQARALATNVHAILAMDTNAAIVVAGDFNENVGGPAQTEGAGISTQLPSAPGGRPAALYNLHAMLPVSEQNTYYYRKESLWHSFDNLSVSAAMLMENRAPWQVDPTGYRVFRESFLLDESGHPIPFRLRYNPDTKRHKYVHGYSDHLPVILRLRPSETAP